MLSMRCTHCNIDKPESEFRPSTLRLNDRKWCRACFGEYERVNWANREGLTREKALASRRSYYQRNKDAQIKRAAIHYRDNIEAYDFWRAKACAKRRGATLFMSREEWDALRRQKTCHWCALELHPSFTHIDHVVPLCEGGQHTAENVVLACANCNMRREWERKTVNRT